MEDSTTSGGTPFQAKNFAEFWPYYLQQHSNPKTRTWHYFGTLAGLLAGAFVLGLYYPRSSIAESLLMALFAIIVVAYGILFVSHWMVEGNQPATLRAFGKTKSQTAKELLWSVRGDFTMLWLALTEKLAEELDRHQVR